MQSHTSSHHEQRKESDVLRKRCLEVEEQSLKANKDQIMPRAAIAGVWAVVGLIRSTSKLSLTFLSVPEPIKYCFRVEQNQIDKNKCCGNCDVMLSIPRMRASFLLHATNNSHIGRTLNGKLVESKWLSIIQTVFRLPIWHLLVALQASQKKLTN